MSTTKENPFTEDENYALLTEILKKAGVPSRRLVALIKEYQITPSWNDIPLPSGRSLNSCQSAYHLLCSGPPPPVNPGPGVFSTAHHTVPAPQMPIGDSGSNARKRPLYPSDKPSLVPIQPRPSPGHGSFGSEAGASAILSPGMSAAPPADPPRKRGRPTKAESEARKLSKAAAEARGETYPAARRSGPQKVKTPSTPTDTATIQPGGSLYTTQTSIRPPVVPLSGMYFQPQPLGTMPVPRPGDDERLKSMPNRENFQPLRELPRPQEPRQTLPSPQALQLGYRESIPRIETGDRSYGPRPPDLLPFSDSSRRTLLHPSPRHPDEPQTPDVQFPLTTTAEKRT